MIRGCHVNGLQLWFITAIMFVNGFPHDVSQGTAPVAGVPDVFVAPIPDGMKILWMVSPHAVEAKYLFHPGLYVVNPKNMTCFTVQNDFLGSTDVGDQGRNPAWLGPPESPYQRYL